MTIFAATPFLGTVFGNIIGGFFGSPFGWKWVQGLMSIITGLLVLIGMIFVPETYSPVLLRYRANRLNKSTTFIYRSKFEEIKKIDLKTHLKNSLSRPWIFLFREPIVLFFSLYMAVIYGILYMLVGAFPIVYHEEKGWSPGIDGLPFLGIGVGIVFGIIYCIFDQYRYRKSSSKYPANDIPCELRLPPSIVGAFALPISLFWFGWTNYPSVHFIIPILSGIPFGFGIVLVFVSLVNYMIDSYVIYSATVMAANSILRSLFGAAFRLFILI